MRSDYLRTVILVCNSGLILFDSIAFTFSTKASLFSLLSSRINIMLTASFFAQLFEADKLMLYEGDLRATKTNGQGLFTTPLLHIHTAQLPHAPCEGTISDRPRRT